jgi:hypothetical protein
LSWGKQCEQQLVDGFLADLVQDMRFLRVKHRLFKYSFMSIRDMQSLKAVFAVFR